MYPMHRVFHGTSSATYSWLTVDSGLSWNTDDNMLRAKFEEFGAVEEAVSSLSPYPDYLVFVHDTMRKNDLVLINFLFFN